MAGAIPSDARPLALVAALAIVLATFPAAGTWTVTLTITDGWGKAARTTRQVTVT